jgi:hypothetical protein
MAARFPIGDEPGWVPLIECSTADTEKIVKLAADQFLEACISRNNEAGGIPGDDPGRQ